MMVLLLVSGGFQLSTKLCVFCNKCRINVRARQDEALSSQRSLSQTQSSCCDWQPLYLEFAAPDSYFESLRVSVFRPVHILRDLEILGSKEYSTPTVRLPAFCLIEESVHFALQKN